MKKNEGEVPQYVVTDSHPAIIDRNEWGIRTSRDGETESEGQAPEQPQPVLRKDLLRGVRRALRLESMALDR